MTAQEWALPIISIGTVALVQDFMPKEMRAKYLKTFLLSIGAIFITAFVVMSECRKFFMGTSHGLLTSRG